MSRPVQTPPEEQVLRAELCRIGALVHQKGFVAANDGNLSVRLSDGGFLITPTGVSKGLMEPDEMVRLSPEGEPVDPEGPRSSSEAKMHLAVYRKDPSIGAVVHTHSPYATYFSTWGEGTRFPHLCADILVQVGEIPVAPYCPLGTWELADTVAGYCLDYNAVLLCNHGVVTWGSSLREAYYRAEAVESYFHIFSLYCQNQGRGNLLTPEQVSQLAQVRRGLGNLKGGE